MARIRSMTAAALGGRRAGSLAIKSLRSTSTGGGTRRRIDETGAGSASRIATINFGMLGASNGGTPAIIRYMTMPRAYRSERGSMGWPSSCSGAM